MIMHMELTHFILCVNPNFKLVKGAYPLSFIPFYQTSFFSFVTSFHFMYYLIMEMALPNLIVIKLVPYRLRFMAIYIGFLQSKDPLKSISRRKASGPALTSLVSQKFLLGKRKKSNSDPMTSFIRELHSDLEMVYVGQMCLSWEILHWQYQKALEIWDLDPDGMRRYNEVAGEFQQFQVLMQRFLENEPFEGPRVQNYVKNRCILRNLLQVPVIRGNF